MILCGTDVEFLLALFKSINPTTTVNSDYLILILNKRIAITHCLSQISNSFDFIGVVVVVPTVISNVLSVRYLHSEIT